LWVNENSSTDGITRVDIHQRLNKFYLHAWGRCDVTECDNGIQIAPTSAIKERSLLISKAFSFKTELQQWTLLQDGRLRVVRHTHFTDGSGRPDYDRSDVFKRQ